MEQPSKWKNIGYTLLVILNLIVLLGQIWPEGAPPFARSVNVIFLVLNLAALVFFLIGRKPK